MEYLVIGVLAAAVVAVVVYPLIRSEVTALDDASLDVEVERYREALRNGTLCDSCLAANAAGSQFCAECGAPLGAGSATEEAEAAS
jgi:hypothetical protein